MKTAAIWIIKLYRNYISPLKLQCCRYYPTCSEYAVNAIQKHGLIKGLAKGAYRILRCNPFVKGGYDPA